MKHLRILMILGFATLLFVLQVGVCVLLIGQFNCGEEHLLHHICWGKIVGNGLCSGLSAWILNRTVLKWNKWLPLLWMAAAFFNELTWECGSAFGPR